MPFTMIAPPAKKAACITISCKALRSSPFKLNISIPAAIHTTTFKDSETFDIHLGNGQDAGTILVQPKGADGKFKAKRLMYTTVIVLPPIEEITPEMQFNPVEVERRDHKDGVLLTLPTWANKDAWKKIKEARARDAAQAGSHVR